MKANASIIAISVSSLLVWSKGFLEYDTRKLTTPEIEAIPADIRETRVQKAEKPIRRVIRPTYLGDYVKGKIGREESAQSCLVVVCSLKGRQAYKFCY